MIRLILTDRALDEVPVALSLVTYFEDVRPLKGQAGLLDWRMNGRLSDLILKQKLHGQRAEALIMPSAGRFLAGDILLLGLGSSQEISEVKLTDLFGMVVDKIRLLKPATVALSFSDLSKDFMTWRALLRAFVAVMTERLRDQDLTLYCTDPTAWIQEARRRNMDFGALVSVSFDGDPVIPVP